MFGLMKVSRCKQLLADAIAVQEDLRAGLVNAADSTISGLRLENTNLRQETIALRNEISELKGKLMAKKHSK